MRTPNRAGTPIPQELNSAECLDHRNAILAAPNTAVNPNYYKGKVEHPDGSVTFTVREALKIIYRNKCAYCEKASHHPKIDHHRPRGTIVGMPRYSPGYYWLCYEWTNLLPSCTDCNSIEAKGSRYPVAAARNVTPPMIGAPPAADFARFIYDADYNLQEHPQLLHPEYCDPIMHFTFDLHGRIFGQTNEGQTTISTLKLDNQDLNGWRRAIYNQKLDSLNYLMNWYFGNDVQQVKDQVKIMMAGWLVDLVRESENEDLEYTLFRKVLVKDFERFFIQSLSAEFRPLMSEIFLDYISSVT